MEYDIFISYKRRGTSSATAAYLYDLLTKKGYSVFFDRKEMGQGAFNEQLYNHIENAKDIIVLLEDQSLAACFKENINLTIEDEASNITPADSSETPKGNTDKKKDSDEIQNDKVNVSHPNSISQAYKTDWFCMEIMHALEVKQKKGNDLHIIPLLLEGYNMPDASKLPPEMRQLAMQNAIKLEISDVETVYQKYFVGEKPYLRSKPTNLFLAQQNGNGVADFLFFSEKNGTNDGHCDIYEFGNLIGRIDQNIDEEHPYIFPVKRAGEHRFKLKNCDTCEEQTISVSAEKDKQQYVPITWGVNQNLWEITPELIKKEDDSRKLYFWGKGLYEGNFKHAPDYRKAFNCLKAAAEHLHYAEARNFIIRNYELFLNKNSKDFKVEKTESISSLKLEWLKAAADFGGSAAQYEYGRRLCQGDGVEKNIKEGVEYYKLAAQEKKELEPKSLFEPDPQALFELGEIYFNGETAGIPKNIQAGLEYYQQAAKLKYTKSMMRLAKIYLNGENGIPKNEQEGIKFYDQAANSNNADTLYILANIYFRGDGIASNIPKSLDYYQQAAELNSLDALYDLGKIYFYGTYCVTKDPTKGFSYYKKAADLNAPKAILVVARILLTGEHGIEKNETLGVEYLEKIEALNDAESLMELGITYINGYYGIAENIEKGKHCFEKILKLDDAPVSTLEKIGKLYLSGLLGLEKDPKKAEQYFEKALSIAVDRQAYVLAKQMIDKFIKGEYSVFFNSQKIIECIKTATTKRKSIWTLIGNLYFDGDTSIPQNIPEAIKCYENAIQDGASPRALEKLTKLYLNGDISKGISPSPEKAICYYKDIAQSNPDFYENLGDLYFHGYAGIPQDTAKALSYYEKKLKLNAFHCGTRFLNKVIGIYLNGASGIQPNPPKAIECYEFAAQSNPNLWENLGDLYFNGTKGINENPLEGINCYEKALDQQIADREIVQKLIFTYQDGKFGLEPNPQKVIDYYRKAASFDPSYWIDLGDLYLNGADGIEINNAEGLKCYEQALQGRDVDDSIVKKIADIHLNGLYGYAANEMDAIHYYEKAAWNNPQIWTSLGQLLLEGRDGYSQNISKGIECYERAIHDSLFSTQQRRPLRKSRFLRSRRRNRKSRPTIENLKSIYLDGNYGQKPNAPLAIELLERLAQNAPEFWVELGDLYYNGYKGLITQNFEKSVEYYERAIQNEYFDAEFLTKIANIYIIGNDSIKQNIPKAIRYYELAALQDSDFYQTLGDLFFNGKNGIETNVEKGLKYYEIAIQDEFINEDIFNKTVQIHLKGEYGIAPNPQKVINYYKSAAKKDPSYWEKLGDLYLEGDNGFESDTKKALECYNKALQNENTFSLPELVDKISKIYIDGKNEIEPDPIKAIGCYEQFAHYDADIWIKLGDLYHEGTNGIDRNINKAAECYENAIKECDGFWQAKDPLEKLTNIYINGVLGIVPNHQKLVNYYKLIAEKDADCWTILGDLYLKDEEGLGIDVEKAVECYTLSIKNNDIFIPEEALEKLKNIYLDGSYGVGPNPQKLIGYYELAAYKDANYWQNIGDIYYEGYEHLIKPDVKKALKYYNRAIRGGNLRNADVIKKVADIYLNGKDEIKPNPQRAIEYYERATQSIPEIWIELGNLYLSNNKDITFNTKKAVWCYEQALQYCRSSSLDKAVTALVNIYVSGEYGITPDPQKVINSYQKAAEKNQKYWTKLGDLYFTGDNGVNRNIEKGIKCYEQGAQEAPYIWIELGLKYYSGNKIEQNYEKAFECFEKAQNSGNNRAELISSAVLEVMYRKGKGINENSERAIGYAKVIDMAIKKARVAARAYNEIAWTLYLIKEYEDALPWAEKAISEKKQHQSHRAASLDTLGCIYQGLGRYEDALQTFQKTLELEHPDAKKHIDEVKSLMDNSSNTV